LPIFFIDEDDLARPCSRITHGGTGLLVLARVVNLAAAKFDAASITDSVIGNNFMRLMPSDSAQCLLCSDGQALASAGPCS
jgi:hypothetical protein